MDKDNGFITYCNIVAYSFHQDAMIFTLIMKSARIKTMSLLHAILKILKNLLNLVREYLCLLNPRDMKSFSTIVLSLIGLLLIMQGCKKVRYINSGEGQGDHDQKELTIYIAGKIAKDSMS